MSKFCICAGILLLCMALPGGESYSELMDRAEKLTAQRYDPGSRAYKIKSKELDDILDSNESREAKIRKLKAFIAEMEELIEPGKKTVEVRKPESPATSDPLKTAVAEAESGDPEAQFRLGMIYWNGKLTPRSVSKAVRWFRRAAGKNHLPARFMLAYSLLHGKGMIPEPKIAFAEFKKLYDDGFAAAGLPLGMLYYEGKTVARNYAAAAQCLKSGMTAPKLIALDIHPELVLGKIYYYGGNGLNPDPALAAQYLKQAGDAPEAQFLLGCLLADGKGVPQDLPGAAKCFRTAMEHGSRPAGVRLGRMYCQGLGVKKDDLEAVRCLTPAADAGDPDAAFLLAEIRADEKSPAADSKNAFQYYRIAARSGNREAARQCGLMLLSGSGVDKDSAAAKQYLSTAAKQGDIQAAFLCAGLERDEKQLEKAAAYYRQAADGGHPEAIRNFAAMALSGHGIKADPELGIRYLKKLADRKDLSALLQLGGIYETGIGSVPANTELAIRYYLTAAELGSDQAQARLAQLYFVLGKTDLAEKYAGLAAGRKNPDALRVLQKLHADDKGEEQQRKVQQYLRDLAESGDPGAIRQYGMLLYKNGNLPEAEHYLSKLPEQGDTELMFIRGDIAYQRADGKANFNLAERLLRQAANAGHPGAMIRLGQMYQRGDGVRQDFRQALRWFMLAANKHDPEGMYLTGSMYYNGEGVSADYAEAYRWFRQAAEQGNILAMQYLSIMFKEGIGVPKNNQEAARWRRKAVEQQK